MIKKDKKIRTTVYLTKQNYDDMKLILRKLEISNSEFINFLIRKELSKKEYRGE